MEPCSILELATTVLRVGWQAYSCLKAVHDAPADVREYLDALESIRKVFADVKDYAAIHERSSFRDVDKMQLDTISAVLQDCQLTFVLQLSMVEKYNVGDATSRFKEVRKHVAFGFSKSSLQQYTTKLQASQNLLSQALIASVGKNTVIIRDEVGAMRSDINIAVSAVKEEQEQRQLCLLEMERYTKTLQGGISMLMDFARTTGIRSGTRLEDMANFLTSHLSLPLDHARKGDITSATKDKGAESDVETTPVGRAQTSDGSEIPLALSDAARYPLVKATAASKRQLTLSTSVQEAVSRMKDSLSLKEQSLIGEVQNSEQLMNLMNGTSGATGRAKFLSALSKMSSSLDVILPSHPEASGVIWGSITFLAESGQELYGDISVGLQEVSDAMASCTRELELYQDEQMFALLSQTYEQMVQHAILCLKIIQPKGAKVRFALNGQAEKTKRSMNEMRRVSEKIMREVDYRHRVEMRNAAHKIVEMHVEQQKMVRMLYDQRTLLESMRQEREVMNLVQGQQKILQIVQRLQLGMQIQRLDIGGVDINGLMII